MKASVYHVESAHDAIVHFTLDDLLPKSHTLALNLSLGTLALLATPHDTSHPRLLAEQQFTLNELCVLIPLLNYFPHYCPYEVLLASFYNGTPDEADIEKSRTRLNEAQREGNWDQEMRPLRNILSRTRLKLRTFCIEVSSILETGYVLIQLSERKQLAG